MAHEFTLSPSTEQGASKALLFIPDISGFTKFVNDTAIHHSQHIVAELMELLIDANEIGLKVSEIEGDAVLFYRFGQAPDLPALLQQCETMFLQFHSHLKRYERDRICSCGACTTAGGLTLKFITHYGPLSELKIKDHVKLHGQTNIEAHKLLKNDVDDTEYLLITDQLLRQFEATPSHFTKGTGQYEDSAELIYHYRSLAALHPRVPEPEQRQSPHRKGKPVTSSIDLAVPMQFAHQIITNSKLKPQYSGGKLDSVKMVDENKVERVGSRHFCIVNNQQLEFEAVYNEFGQQKIEFAERATKLGPVKDVLIFYTVKKQEDKSVLTIDAHFNLPAWIGWLLNPLFRSFIRRNQRSAMVQLKEFVERLYLSEQQTKKEAPPQLTSHPAP